MENTIEKICGKCGFFRISKDDPILKSLDKDGICKIRAIYVKTTDTCEEWTI